MVFAVLHKHERLVTQGPLERLLFSVTAATKISPVFLIYKAIMILTTQLQSYCVIWARILSPSPFLHLYFFSSVYFFLDFSVPLLLSACIVSSLLIFAVFQPETQMNKLHCQNTT